MIEVDMCSKMLDEFTDYREDDNLYNFILKKLRERSCLFFKFLQRARKTHDIMITDSIAIIRYVTKVRQVVFQRCDMLGYCK